MVRRFALGLCDGERRGERFRWAHRQNSIFLKKKRKDRDAAVDSSASLCGLGAFGRQKVRDSHLAGASAICSSEQHPAAMPASTQVAIAHTHHHTIYASPSVSSPSPPSLLVSASHPTTSLPLTSPSSAPFCRSIPRAALSSFTRDTSFCGSRLETPSASRPATFLTNLVHVHASSQREFLLLALEALP